MPLVPSGLVVPILLPEHWYENSFSALPLKMVLSPIEATWPGTPVSVVAMFGMAKPWNRPPSSRVSLRSCV